MRKQTFTETTRRDVENVREACRDLWQDMRSPLFWLGLLVVLFFLVAPWVLTAEDLAW